MKALYARSYRDDILQAIAGDRQITAEEHAFASEQQYAAAFATKDILLRASLSDWHLNLGAVGRIRDLINEYGHKVVVSFGAGICVLEYLIELATPRDVRVVATDYDAFFIRRANELFPEITALKFDMILDKVGLLENEIGGRIDAALLYSAAPVLADEHFVNFFTQLRRSNCQMIIQFSSGLPWWHPIAELNSRLRSNPTVRRLFGKSPLPPEVGKLHAWARTRSEETRLYARSGWRVISQFSFNEFPHCLILT